jgi:endonuclease YncB( thermonuclease family)
MKNHLLYAQRVLGITFWLVATAASAAGREAAWVDWVDDGDTIKVTLTETKVAVTIRLTDIDAPEIGHGQSRPGQPFGRKAKAAMAQILHHKHVDLECYPGETYGRRICRVFVDGVDAGDALVAMGLAWAYRENPKYVRDKRIYAVEEAARTAGLGLWGVSQNMPPWEWRKTCWQRQECPVGEDQ